MIYINISPEDSTLEELVASLEAISSKIMPNTYRSFKMASKLIEYTWKTYALGADMGGGMRLKRPTGAYARSIRTRFLSPFNYEIYSDSRIAKYLEDGTSGYDMKKTHPFGKRSRVGARGQGYLIIPFRHGVPRVGGGYYSTIPIQVFRAIQEVKKRTDFVVASRVKGRRYEPNYRGELIPRAIYSPGATRIFGTGEENLEGMVVVRIPTGKERGRSAYMTFRVISERSPAFKWIQLPRPAMKITKHVAENTKGAVKDLIETGLRKDLGI